MPAHDAATPQTIEMPPLFGGILRTFRTTREIPVESSLPVVGTTVPAPWGTAYSTNLVTGAGSEPLSASRKVGWITHVAVPVATSAQTLTNASFSTDRKTLVRRWVMRRSEYDAGGWAAPAIGTADGTYASYKFGSQELQDIPDDSLSRFHVVLVRVYALENETLQTRVDIKPGITTTSTTTIKDAIPVSGNYSAQLEERGWLVTAESASIRAGTITQSVDARPYGTLTTTATYSGTSSVPNPGTGSSKLIYDDGVTTIFENTADSMTARVGSAGNEVKSTNWGKITTALRYATSNTFTGSGSARVVYNDGITVVYEVGEETPSLDYTDGGTELDKKPFVEFSTAITYGATASITSPTGSANVIYRDGAFKVYENRNITATARTGFAGADIDGTPWGQIVTTSNYTTSATLVGPGNLRTVYNDGTTTVYQADVKEARLLNPNGGTEKDGYVWGTITKLAVYSNSPNLSTVTGRSRVAYSDGQTIIYETVNETASVTERTYTGGKSKDAYTTKTKTIKISTESGDSAADMYDSRVLWTNGTVFVYEIEETAIAANAHRTWIEQMPVKWPAVLVSLHFINWTKTNGDVDVFPQLDWVEGRNEPQDVTVERWWQDTEPVTTDRTEPMVEEGFEVNWPGFRMVVPQCLHDGGVITFTLSNDSTYVAGNFRKVINQTTPHKEWPAQKIWYETREHLNGWMVTKYTANRPKVVISYPLGTAPLFQNLLPLT